jgi:drug/metabolite transporter (DMT)-like permease
MHEDALSFGALSPSSRKRRPLPRAAWTGIGAVSIPLWATWPTLAVWAATMPAFEVLTIAFAVGWLVLARLERSPSGGAARPHRGPMDALPVLACALGLSGANAGFILATASIPPAQANLIAYLWPIMVVALGGALGLFRLRPRHIVGLALGFGGAAMVIGGQTLTTAWSGIGLALLSGASWAAYCVFRLRQGAAATNVLAQGCGVSALLCAGLHLALEPTVLPGPGAFIAAVGIGIAPLALANFAWDQGLRRGDSQLLTVMAYATPLASALILVAIGLAAATINLVVGALLIVGAGILSKSEPRRG